MKKGSNITEAQLTPNAQIFVRGNVSYARLTRHIDGEELKADNQRRTMNGWIPVGKRYTTITVTNARIQAADPAHMTPDEQFVEGKFYTSNADPNVYNYTINNKSPYLPYIAQASGGDLKDVKEIVPEGELASGLDVILVLRIFQGKGASAIHKGLSLDGVICVDPIRYFDANNAKARLASRGITFTPLSADERNAYQNSEAERNAAAAPDTTFQIAPAPTTPFSTTQAAAPAATTPFTGLDIPTEAPADAGTWTCPHCGTKNSASSNFCGKCGKPKNEPAAPTGGIQYDPDSANRAY